MFIHTSFIYSIVICVFFWIDSMCLCISHRCFCAVDRVKLTSVKMLEMVKDRIMEVYDSILAGRGKTLMKSPRTQVYYSRELNYGVGQTSGRLTSFLSQWMIKRAGQRMTDNGNIYKTQFV